MTEKKPKQPKVNTLKGKVLTVCLPPDNREARRRKRVLNIEMGVSGVAQGVKELVTNPDTPSLTPRTHRVERQNDTCKLASGLYRTPWHMCFPPTINK